MLLGALSSKLTGTSDQNNKSFPLGSTQELHQRTTLYVISLTFSISQAPLCIPERKHNHTIKADRETKGRAECPRAMGTRVHLPFNPGRSVSAQGPCKAYCPYWLLKPFQIYSQFRCRLCGCRRQSLLVVALSVCQCTCPLIHKKCV
jgi:hypothetical protein